VWGKSVGQNLEEFLQQSPIFTITFEQSSGFRIVRIDIGNEKANEEEDCVFGRVPKGQLINPNSV
jgi:hypothetical protein